MSGRVDVLKTGCLNLKIDNVCTDNDVCTVGKYLYSLLMSVLLNVVCMTGRCLYSRLMSVQLLYVCTTVKCRTVD